MRKNGCPIICEMWDVSEGKVLNFAAEESESRMHKPIKYVEKAVTVAATGAWAVFARLNRVAPNPSPTPKWSEKPLP